MPAMHMHGAGAGAGAGAGDMLILDHGLDSTV